MWVHVCLTLELRWVGSFWFCALSSGELFFSISKRKLENELSFQLHLSPSLPSIPWSIQFREKAFGKQIWKGLGKARYAFGSFLFFSGSCQMPDPWLREERPWESGSASDQNLGFTPSFYSTASSPASMFPLLLLLQIHPLHSSQSGYLQM